VSIDRNDVVSWGVLAAGLLIAAGLVAFTHSLPRPAPADADAGSFSAERAMRLVTRLTDEIGHRPNGTAAHARAAEVIADELRAIPGVEVELQHVGGVQQYPQDPFPFPPFIYETTNVVARIEGRSTDAVLLDAHFDTLTDSVGAGDDAMGVAALVEAARAIAQGPELAHSIVLNVNGAEEVGLLGAAGFLQHRYARDVKAYIYLDTGPQGRPVIIGAGPGNGWLLETYASAARSPSATVIGQDLIDSGLLPHNGDFRPFHDAGLIGIDVAALGDFWAIHTPLDRPERIDHSTLQLMGDDLLGGARGLAQSALPGNIDHGATVYYDLLGSVMLVYSMTTARVLAAIVLALLVGALVLARRRGALTARQVGGALLRVALVALAAFIAALLAGVLLSFVIGRPHGWFSAPWIAVWAFGAPAIAAAIGVLALRRRCPPETAPLATWAGALLLWAIWLTLAAIAGAGSGYIPLWWAGPGVLAFIVALLRPRWRRWLWLLAFVPGAVLTLSFVVIILPFLCADIGLVPAPVPLDGLVAAFIGVTVAVIVPVAVVPIAGFRRLGRVALVGVAIAAGGVIAAAVHHPYTADRPKRVRAAVVVRGGESALLVASHDALPLDEVLADVPEAVPYDPPWSPIAGFDPPFSYQLPAAPPGFDAPHIEVLSSSYDASRDARTVRIRLVSDGPQLRLLIPTTSLRGWSLGPVPERSLDENRTLAIFEGAGPEARELTLELGGREPVDIELYDVRGPSTAPELEALRRRLPPWTALHAQEIWSIVEHL